MKKTVLLFFILLLISGCEKAPETSSAVGFQFDTVVTLTGYCDQSVLDGALEECARYESLFSRTVEGSDVWNINNAHGGPVTVSPETAEVLNLALEISRSSGGAFDVTVAPASSLWDFKSDDPSPPDEAELKAASEKTGWTKLSLDGNTVTLPDGCAIDLGGIAKGYAVDRIAKYLSERGVECAVINFGGNTYMLGQKPDGSAWRLGIQDPASERGAYLSELEVYGGSAATSGTYERCFEKDGVLYHHILDPKTGWPVRNGLSSVTVLCESAAVADALSTACFVLGIEKGSELMLAYGAEGVFITDSGNEILTDGIK